MLGGRVRRGQLVWFWALVWQRPRGLLEGSIRLLLALFPGDLLSHPGRGSMVTPFEDPQPKGEGTVGL